MISSISQVAHQNWFKIGYLATLGYDVDTELGMVLFTVYLTVVKSFLGW
jgi:hypothetical protein